MFDKNGHRIDFLLEIIEFAQKKNAPLTFPDNGFKKIGTWDAVKRIAYTRTASEKQEQEQETWGNKTFIVVSRIGKPFLDYRYGQRVHGGQGY